MIILVPGAQYARSRDEICNGSAQPGRDDGRIARVLTAKKLAPAIREAMHSGVLKGAFEKQDLDLDELEAVGIES